MIHQRICKECGNLIDIENCPYCIERKKKEVEDGKRN